MPFRRLLLRLLPSPRPPSPETRALLDERRALLDALDAELQRHEIVLLIRPLINRLSHPPEAPPHDPV